MLFETRFERDLIVITPLGSRLDFRVATAFRDAIIDRIDQGHHRVLVNLERVQFMDSSGIGALMSGIKRMGRGGDIAVCSLSTKVQSMFELTHLDRVIRVADSTVTRDLDLTRIRAQDS